MNASSGPLAEFQALGNRIEDCWKVRNFDSAVFPEIAGQILEEADLSLPIALEEVVRCLSTAPTVPPVHEFSDLSFRVFETSEFFIELLVWLRGSVAIHEHSFGGAFRVLEGKSVHARYSFQFDERISRRFGIGRAEITAAEVLRKGDVRRIFAGAETMHSLYHFERPSITLVVRTHHEPWSTPQLEVDRPHFAIDYDLLSDARVVFCERSLKLLASIDVGRAEKTFVSIVMELDFPRAYAICNKLFYWDFVTSDRLGAVLEKEFGESGALVKESILVMRRLHKLQQLREILKSPEEQFLLALVAIVPSKALAMQLARENIQGGSAADSIANVLLTIMNHGGFPFRLSDESALEVLKFLLEYPKKGEFFRAVKKSFDDESYRSHIQLLDDIFDELHIDPLIGNLFSE